MLNELLKYSDNKTLTIDFSKSRIEIGSRYGASFKVGSPYMNNISYLDEILIDAIRLGAFDDYDNQLQYFKFLQRSFTQDSMHGYDMEVIDYRDFVKHNIKFVEGVTFVTSLLDKNFEIHSEGVTTTQTYPDFESMVADLENYHSVRSYELTRNGVYKLRGWLKRHYKHAYDNAMSSKMERDDK